MTDAARRDESDSNLSAFDLGVYANQFLWNLDQAFVVPSEPHRRVALGLIQRLRVIGNKFTEDSRNTRLEKFLETIKGYLPETLEQDRSEMLGEFEDFSFHEESKLRDGERWYKYLGSIGQEREKLLNIIRKTLQLTQRAWFDLGVMIDSGQHPPDTGNWLYKFNPPKIPRFTTLISQSSLTNDDESEVPLLQTFEPGGLPPQSEWWQELWQLCEELTVPCNSVEPDLSTTNSVVATVEEIIKSVRTTIKATVLTPLIVLREGHQQPAVGSPSAGTTRQYQEAPSPAGGQTDVLDGNSTERGGEKTAVSQSYETLDPMTAPKQPDEKKAQYPVSAITESASERAVDGELNTEQCTRFGRWLFYQHEVKFDNLSRLKMTNQFRMVLESLLKHPYNAVDQSTLLKAGWGPNHGRDARTLKPLISKLRKRLRIYLNNTLEVPVLQKLILCPARGKDLCYRFNVNAR